MPGFPDGTRSREGSRSHLREDSAGTDPDPEVFPDRGVKTSVSGALSGIRNTLGLVGTAPMSALHYDASRDVVGAVFYKLP